MEISTFAEKTRVPTEEDLIQALGKTYSLWLQIKEEVLSRYRAAIEEWKYPGAKYGWSFRMKDKKRAIIYLIPREGFFEVGFVFGQKACLAVYESEVKKSLKEQLEAAKSYSEGKGLRFEVKEKSIMKSIKLLIEIKLSH